MRSDICIIGAGPAGLMAAICAARNRATVILVEANGTPGRKLLVTGGGRCNITHDATIDEFVRAFGRTGRFLRHSLHEMSPAEVRTFFHDRELPTMVESDGCVFPSDGRAVDVLRILRHEAKQLDVRLLCGSPVIGMVAQDGAFAVGTATQDIFAKSAIVATGGVSWPQTGSTGDGYRFATALGHSVVRPKAALVPLVTREHWPGDLAGVAVSDARIHTESDPRKTVSRGAIVFTQDGIGGPAAQDMSRLLAHELANGDANVGLRIDLMPKVHETELDRQLQQQLAANAKKAVANVLAELVPRRLASMLCVLADCDGDTLAGQMTKVKRKAILTSLKSLPLHARGTRPIAEATVTCGGIDTQEIDSKTMASKVRPGLFFAGEVIDVDGPCGGYNLQMCFSTGALAGRAAARYLAGL
jgi:predicted Rossmann fold flavoprotein